MCHAALGGVAIAPSASSAASSGAAAEVALRTQCATLAAVSPFSRRDMVTEVIEMMRRSNRSMF
jgi:hypothetical protein